MTNNKRIAGRILRRQPSKKNDNDIRITNWNVRTLYRPGALHQLLDVLSEYKADITAIQETRFTGNKNWEKGTYTIFCSGNSKKHVFGTAFIISKRIKHLILDFQPISSRLCKLRIKGKFFNYSFINTHAPIEDSSDDEKDFFYQELERVWNTCPRHDIKIILGDLNAKVGQEPQFLRTIGNHSLHKESNDNGLRLINFAATTKMVIVSTYFPRKKIHKGTWKSPDGQTVNQIDHVLIDARHFTDVIDVKTKRGANIDSDHYLVQTKLRAKISNANKTPKRDKLIKYNTEQLKDPDVVQQYQQEIEVKLNEANIEIQNSNIDEYWAICKRIIQNAAENTLGKRKSIQKTRKNGQWFDNECKEITVKKNHAYRQLQHAQATRSMKEQYSRLRRKEKQIHKKKKKQYLEQQLKELENINRYTESRKFYQTVNKGRKGFESNINMCRDSEGNIITDEEKILERWVENFDKRLNLTKTTTTTASTNAQNDHIINKEQSPTLDEVTKSISRLRNNKAAGLDGISAELIKNGGEALSKSLHKLIRKIWDQTRIPEEWYVGLITPIHKKGDKLDCDNYRGITLLNIAYKVLAHILYERLLPYAEKVIGTYQCGFRSNKSTTDQVHTIRMILEKTLEYNIETHHLFVDFKSAYDTVDREKLYDAMRSFSFPPHLIELTKETLKHVECRIKVQNKISSPFNTHTGLRQGDPLSCLLFNIALEKAIRESGIRTKYTILNGPIQLLAYADDIDIMSRTMLGLIEAFTSLEKAAKHMGLQINEEKTKYMYVPARNIKNPPAFRHITINNKNIESVSEFIYLGSQINTCNNISSEVQRRIFLANRAYYGLSRYLRSDILSRTTKVLLYKVLIRPVLSYGSETWTLSKHDEHLIACFERKILRTIFKAVCVNGEWRKRYNFELYQLYGEPDIVNFIKTGRLRWIGHVERMSDQDPAKRVILQNPGGKRSAGRPKARYVDQIEKDLKILNVKDWRTLARSRERWRDILQQARTHPGLLCQD